MRKAAESPAEELVIEPAGAAIEPDLRLSQQICFALYSTSRAVTHAYRPLLDEMGLTYPQYLVMLVLWEEDDRNVGQIGEQLMLDSGTLTPLLKRLESRGLIVRTRKATDERQVSVRLTEAGQTMRDSAAHVMQEIGCRLGMTGEEFVALHRQLAKIKQSLAISDG